MRAICLWAGQCTLGINIKADFYVETSRNSLVSAVIRRSIFGIHVFGSVNCLIYAVQRESYLPNLRDKKHN